MQQDFESAGTPTGWTNTNPAKIIFHNTTTPLEGTGDLSLTGGTSPISQAYYTFVSPLTECWVVAMLKCIALPSSGSTTWFGTQSATLTNVSFLNLTSAGVVRPANNGAFLTSMVNPVVAGTLYYFKMHYKVGTGANSIGTFELSTTGTFINSGNFYSATTTGASTTNAGTLVCQNQVDGEFRFDHIRVSATDLGNNFSSWT